MVGLYSTILLKQPNKQDWVSIEFYTRLAPVKLFFKLQIRFLMKALQYWFLQ